MSERTPEPREESKTRSGSQPVVRVVRSQDGVGLWTALSSLRSVQFRRVFVSNLTLFLAMQGQGLVRAVIVYELTNSELALGMVSASVALTRLLA